MKKARSKKLLVSIEKVRDLQHGELERVAGGGGGNKGNSCTVTIDPNCWRSLPSGCQNSSPP